MMLIKIQITTSIKKSKIVNREEQPRREENLQEKKKYMNMKDASKKNNQIRNLSANKREQLRQKKNASEKKKIANMKDKSKLIRIR